MRDSILLVTVVLIIIFVRRYFSQKFHPKTIENLSELMQHLASEAVRDAERENGVQLDYGIDSIKIADDVLGRIHEQYTKNPASIRVRGLAPAYGAYIGEVIRRLETDSRWERDDEAIGVNRFPLIFRDGSRIFPIGWCHKRILNGEEDNIWLKYQVIKNKSIKTPDSEAPSSN